MMIIRVHFNLLLAVLLIQWCKNESKICQEAIVSSLKSVPKCPTLKENRDIAAKKKNCFEVASRKQCSTAEKYKYHCVINSYRNETMEVCAHNLLILGVCTEFNVAGGVLQGQNDVVCNDKFPKCDKIYNATDAYKYPDCYKLINNTRDNLITTMPSPETTSYQTEKILRNTTTHSKAPRSSTTEFNYTPIIVVSVFLVAVIVVLAILCLKKRWYMHVCKKRKPRASSIKMEEGENLIAGALDEGQGNKVLLKNTKSVSVKNTESASTTDKYGYASSKTVVDFLEENKEESSRYLKYYKGMDQYFVETGAYRSAKKIFDKNGIVIMTGPPGCGKTISAIHMILKQERIWTFRKIQSWEELSYIDKNEHTLVFIDNIFFRRTMELQLEKWWDEFEKIYAKYFAVNEETNSFRLRIIMTARQNAITRACSYMDKTPPILHDNFVKDVSRLTEAEKDQIFKTQIEFAKKEKNISVYDIDEAFRAKVKKSDGPIGFPLCAHLYVCGMEYRKSGESFFTRPIQYLKLQIKDEIESDKTNRTKSLFFYLFFFEWHTKMGYLEKIDLRNESNCKRFLERISGNLLEKFDPFDFKDMEAEAQRLSGAFFKKVGKNAYRFVHDSVYEAVGTYFCETYVSEAAKYFPLDIIRNQNFNFLTQGQKEILSVRLLYDALDRNFSEVFSCKIFENADFANLFCSELMKKDAETIARFFTIPNESSNVKLPCIFWSSCNDLTFLTEEFYKIIKTKGINPEDQLYVSLYGTCCTRHEGLLKTTNGMFRDNYEKIKDHVQSFVDKKGNCILHILIASKYSDWFAAIAVKTLGEDEKCIDSRNNDNVTPLMVTVEQTLPRRDVLQNLIKFSRKLNYKDREDSTMFHHCLRSSNNDETCAEYLEILINKLDGLKSLKNNDVNGDTALSIAAKETKRSRILSILKLLESGVDITNTLNKEGYSPLHLSVKSLKAGSTWVELECCVRVITLIIFGANLENLSDRNVKAIDECASSYGCVKDILSKPTDIENMEDHLDLLLEKAKKHKGEEKQKKVCISSNKLSAGDRKSVV